MLERLRSLPGESLARFQEDPRTVAAAESYLRRGLEALLDLGRHILAGGFGQPVVEYKEIAIRLREKGVLEGREKAARRGTSSATSRLLTA